jgi:hypothetical protein
MQGVASLLCRLTNLMNLTRKSAVRRAHSASFPPEFSANHQPSPLAHIRSKSDHRKADFGHVFPQSGREATFVSWGRDLFGCLAPSISGPPCVQHFKVAMLRVQASPQDDSTSQIEPEAAAPTPVFAFTPETSPIGAVANPDSGTLALRQQIYAINMDRRPATPETDHLWRRDLSM